MGGYNSGGHNRTHKTVENYRRIDSFAFYHHLMGDKYLSCKDNVKYRGTSGNIIYHVQDKTAEIETGGLCVPLKLSRGPGINPAFLLFLLDFTGHTLDTVQTRKACIFKDFQKNIS